MFVWQVVVTGVSAAVALGVARYKLITACRMTEEGHMPTLAMAIVIVSALGFDLFLLNDFGERLTIFCQDRFLVARDNDAYAIILALLIALSSATVFGAVLMAIFRITSYIRKMWLEDKIFKQCSSCLEDQKKALHTCPHLICPAHIQRSALFSLRRSDIKSALAQSEIVLTECGECIVSIPIVSSSSTGRDLVLSDQEVRQYLINLPLQGETNNAYAPGYVCIK